MTIFNKIFTVFNRYGLLFIIKHFYYELYYDFKFGISTMREKQLKNLTIESENKIQGEKYQPSSYYKLNKVIKHFSINLEHECILDLGCGKARFLFFAAVHGARKAIGVEFAKEIFEIANSNKVKFLKKNSNIKTDIKIVLSDVVDYVIDDEVTIVFLFNPFKEKVTGKIIENINNSLIRNPRKIQIIYLNPVHAALFDKHFKTQASDNSEFNIPVKLYSN
jgi:SAM-dependent methyltransferase